MLFHNFLQLPYVVSVVEIITGLLCNANLFVKGNGKFVKVNGANRFANIHDVIIDEENNTMFL